MLAYPALPFDMKTNRRLVLAETADGGTGRNNDSASGALVYQFQSKADRNAKTCSCEGFLNGVVNPDDSSLGADHRPPAAAAGRQSIVSQLMRLDRRKMAPGHKRLDQTSARKLLGYFRTFDDVLIPGDGP